MILFLQWTFNKFTRIYLGVGYFLSLFPPLGYTVFMFQGDSLIKYLGQFSFDEFVFKSNKYVCFGSLLKSFSIKKTLLFSILFNFVSLANLCCVSLDFRHVILFFTDQKLDFLSWRCFCIVLSFLYWILPVYSSLTSVVI